MLASYSDSSNNITYTYDASGMRTGKSVTTSEGTINSYTYVYENGLLLQMCMGSRIYDFSYDANGTPVSIAYRTRATATPTYYYYGVNSRGDVELLYNSSGSVVAVYKYDAYGKLNSVENASGVAITSATHIANMNPLRYRSYVYDNETGFYYLQSRYYDPVTCRFVNADGQLNTDSANGFNMFVYCNGNPVMMADPNGTCSRFLGFLWKIDCYKATCKDSKCYNPSAGRVAVIYDNRSSGFLWGLFGGTGFSYQGERAIEDLSVKYDVESYTFTTMQGYIDSWNSLDGHYDRVYVLSHGYPGGLSCNGKSIDTSNSSDYSFEELEEISTDAIYLYSCNGATPNGQYGSVASELSKLANAPVLAVANGSIGYTWKTSYPYADGGVWSVTYN